MACRFCIFAAINQAIPTIMKPRFFIAAGDDEDVAYGIAALPPVICLAGGFMSSNLTFGSTVLSSQGVNDMFVAKIEDILSVKESGNDNYGFLVYPNPADERIIINLDGDYEDCYELIVSDNTGRIVYSSKEKSNDIFQIDVKSYNAGLYTVRLYNNSGFSRQARIVIMH